MLTMAVSVPLKHFNYLICRHPQSCRNMLHYVLHYGHSLWRAEPPKSSAGGNIGSTQHTGQVHVGDAVGISHGQQTAFGNLRTELQMWVNVQKSEDRYVG